MYEEDTKGKGTDAETTSLSDKVSVTNYRVHTELPSKMHLLPQVTTNPQKGTAHKETSLYLQKCQSHENKNTAEPQCLGLKASQET